MTARRAPGAVPPAAPRVSVVMPVFNGAAHVAEAIDSVLAQSYRAFELLVVDDGSTDGSLAVIRAFADPRIRVIAQARNQGLIATLNHAFAEARGAYLVRMDCDDVAHPDRIAKQVAYLDAHPEVGVLGTCFELFGAQSGIVRYHERDAVLRVFMLFECAIGHPTVALRRACVSLPFYDAAYPHAEDYEAWSRLMLAGTRFAVLPEVLLRYRTHPGQVSKAGQAVQVASADRVRQQWFRALGMEPTPAEEALHRELGRYAPCADVAHLRRLDAYLTRLHRANEATEVFDRAAFRAELASRLRGALLSLPRVDREALRITFRSALFGADFWGRPSFWRVLRRAAAGGSRSQP